MRVKLDRQVGWKGQVYSGDCEIPDDLAIALGLAPRLAPAQPESGTPDNESSVERSAEDSPPTPKPSSRRRRTEQ